MLPKTYMPQTFIYVINIYGTYKITYASNIYGTYKDSYMLLV